MEPAAAAPRIPPDERAGAMPSPDACDEALEVPLPTQVGASPDPEAACFPDPPPAEFPHEPPEYLPEPPEFARQPLESPGPRRHLPTPYARTPPADSSSLEPGMLARLAGWLVGGECARLLASRLQFRAVTLVAFVITTFVVALLCGVYLSLPEPGRESPGFASAPEQSGDASGAGIVPALSGAGAAESGGLLAPAAARDRALPPSMPYWSPQGIVHGDGTRGETLANNRAEAGGAPAGGPEVRNEIRHPPGATPPGPDPGPEPPPARPDAGASAETATGPAGAGAAPVPPPEQYFWLVRVRLQVNREEADEIRQYFLENLSYDVRLEPDSGTGLQGEPLYRVYLDREFATKPEADAVCRIIAETAVQRVFKRNYFLDTLPVRRSR